MIVRIAMAGQKSVPAAPACQLAEKRATRGTAVVGPSRVLGSLEPKMARGESHLAGNGCVAPYFNAHVLPPVRRTCPPPAPPFPSQDRWFLPAQTRFQPQKPRAAPAA